MSGKANGRERYADLFEGCGFHIVETGGGCTAWQCNLYAGDGSEAGYILVTGDEASIPDDDDELIQIGFYSPESDPLVSFSCLNRASIVDRALMVLIGYVDTVNGTICETENVE